MNSDNIIKHEHARMVFEAIMGISTMRTFRVHHDMIDSCSTDISPDRSPIRRRNISPETRKREFDLMPSERFEGTANYFEVAEKNAQELIKEEEKARIKAEKKKAKKERQRQKKVEQKTIATQTNAAINISNKKSSSSNTDNVITKISGDMENLAKIRSDNKETEGLDIHAAFVSKAVKKIKNTPIIPVETKSKKEEKDINSLIKIALEYENSENFKNAVHYYSEAINIAPNRLDLILKRSFVYYELAKFEKSIRDAQKVIKYSPNNCDGYYRLGEAHFALNNLVEAEAAFSKLLTLNAHSEESKNRLFSIRIKQLESMGYNPNEAFTALLKSKNKTIDEAIDFLTALETGKQTTEDLYYSDEDESEDDYEEEETNKGGASGSSESSIISPAKSTIKLDKKSPLLVDASNPLRCCSLFVGNLKPGITYKEVYDVFIKFGELRSIKVAEEPNCYAFVNYTESTSAGQAMEALQSSRWLLSTVPLLVKYPTKIILSTIPTMANSELILSKLNALPPVQPTVTKSSITSRPRPPPKTEECFYWRTSGCVYGKKCFNLHIPEHEGIALQIKKRDSTQHILSSILHLKNGF